MTAIAGILNVNTRATCAPVVQALCDTLEQLRSLLGTLSPSHYATNAGELFSNGTIGGHVRHTLDHIRALTDGNVEGQIDYDHRERGTAIEFDLAAAQDELDRLAAVVTPLARVTSAKPVSVTVMPSHDGNCVSVASTLGRELAFALSHTVHHNATIRSMVIALGHQVPASFGYAPSTLASREHSVAGHH